MKQVQVVELATGSGAPIIWLFLHLLVVIVVPLVEDFKLFQVVIFLCIFIGFTVAHHFKLLLVVSTTVCYLLNTLVTHS